MRVDARVARFGCDPRAHHGGNGATEYVAECRRSWTKVGLSWLTTIVVRPQQPEADVAATTDGQWSPYGAIEHEPNVQTWGLR